MIAYAVATSVGTFYVTVPEYQGTTATSSNIPITATQAFSSWSSAYDRDREEAERSLREFRARVETRGTHEPLPTEPHHPLRLPFPRPVPPVRRVHRPQAR